MNHQTTANAATATPQTIEFVYYDPGATSVFVAGTFNDWSPTATPMLKFDTGIWARRISLAPGDYEYRFIIDGVWIPDPRAEQMTLNAYGGLNSIVSVKSPAQEPTERRKRRRFRAAPRKKRTLTAELAQP